MTDTITTVKGHVDVLAGGHLRSSLVAKKSPRVSRCHLLLWFGG